MMGTRPRETGTRGLVSLSSSGPCARLHGPCRGLKGLLRGRQPLEPQRFTEPKLRWPKMSCFEVNNSVACRTFVNSRKPPPPVPGHSTNRPPAAHGPTMASLSPLTAMAVATSEGTGGLCPCGAGLLPSEAGPSPQRVSVSFPPRLRVFPRTRRPHFAHPWFVTWGWVVSTSCRPRTMLLGQGTCAPL